MIRPWYAFYPGDYANDTAHLSLTEHGAYRLLLDQYYMTGKPLLANASRLLVVCRAFAKDDADAVLRVLAEFFDLRADGYHHKRADDEIAKAAIISERRRDAGKMGLRARYANGLANGKQLPAQSQSQSQSQQQTQKKEQSARKPRAGASGSRWPADAVVSDDWLREGAAYREVSKMPPVDLRLEAERFQNYWASKSGAGATKTDWKRTWLNWCINTKGAANGSGKGQSGGLGPAGAVFLDNYLRARADREGSGG